MQQNQWEEINNRLIRTFFFKDYDSVVEFSHKVMEIAKKHDHHPIMIIHYDNVKLTIFDMVKERVTDKCHKFALVIDKI